MQRDLRRKDVQAYRDKIGQLAESMYSRGMSLNAIAELFEEAGVLNRRGIAKWTPSTVRGLLPVNIELRRSSRNG